MKHGGSIALVVAVVFGGTLLITGCGTTATRHKWLTLFFDGVPPETSAHPAGGQLGPAAGPAKVAVAAKPAPPKPPPNVVHPPFAQNQCGKCHERSTISAGTKLPLRQLCFTCHKDFLTGMKVKHQPVDEADCTACHAP